MPSPTIRDVAREAGVSTATVSYVLNNSRRVGEETRLRVLEAAQRLGYRANIMARNLQARETRLLGYTWRPTPPDQFNPILDQFLNAIAQAAAHHGYRVLTFPSATIEEELAIYQDMVLTGQVDGFILSNTNLNDKRVRSLLDVGFPFVAFGRSNPEWDFSWVDVNGKEGTAMAVKHLLDRGYRRIGHLAWPADSLTGQYRLSGYWAALRAAGVTIDPAWVVRTENRHGDAYEKTRHLLRLPQQHRPDAIVASSDLMAIGAINAALDAGLEIGKDLAIVGFDDAPVARYLRPHLTTLRQPVTEIGERLITMLVALCQGRPVEDAHILLCPELIVRDSSGARPPEP
ncbi:MAG: LacI family transcriptional regulator [Chloroflexi bacterium]|nr:LacI family transcriptional regulator [Chloroflexota bacterium]